MIGALISILSLDMTRKLIEAGSVALALSVAGASNTTPIVLTTSAPHKIVRPSHGVVSGVGGNTAANGLWVLTPTSTTTLSLTAFDMQGNRVDSVGTGSYTSGGTIQIAFPDGGILLGRRNIAMQTAVATPRIVFVPVGSPAWGLEPFGGVIPFAPSPVTQASQTAEQRTMMLRRQLATEQHRFEVHVSGCAVPPDPDFGDFDVTQALYHSLFESLFDLITPERARVLSGRWESQEEGMQSFDTRGQRWVGQIEIHQPVLPGALSFAPASTSAQIVVNFLNASSADETIIVV
jgi:hypothetical protein